MTAIPQTILLIDNCREARETYRRYLLQSTQYTYKILETDFGKRALELCQQEVPDVILLNYVLPDISGVEFLNQLKICLDGNYLPVIILVEQAYENLAIQAVQWGAFDYLVREHTTPEQFHCKINNVLVQNQLVQQLEESKQQFWTTFEQMAVGVAHLEPDGQCILVNQKLCELLGYTQQELLKQTLQDITHPDDLDGTQDYIQCILATKTQVYVAQKRLIRKDRTRVWTHLTISLARDIFGEPIYLIVTIQDITEQKRLEQALLQAYSQAKAQDVQKRTSEHEAIDQELWAVLEEKETANQPLNCLHNIVTLEHQFYRDLFKFIPEGCVTVDSFGNRIVPECAATSLLATQENQDNKPLYTFFTSQEGTTFRQQLQQRLHTAYNELEKQVKERTAELCQANTQINEQTALLDIVSDAIFVFNLEQHISFWNSGAERLYGWQKSEIIGKRTTEVFNRCVKFEEAVKTVFKQGFWQGESHQMTKDGNNIIVQSRWTLIKNEQGQPQSILVVNTDITEKKQLEAQLRHTQRLESLGTLASGIAHDLNNILTPILTIAQMLPLKLPNLSEQNQQLLKMLEDSSMRGTELVKQILSFARGIEGKCVPLQVKHLLKEIERIAKSTFPKSIEIHTNISTPTPWIILANPTQIHQVLMNLVVNARDAMPNGGTLTLAAENFVVDENYARMNLEATVGSYVAITVADTGCGIPQNLLKRIFEPFFSTKEPGKGTGLGLSTALGIIKNHGGFVQVSSEIDQGSQFKVYLPATHTDFRQETFGLAYPRGNGELILIVDDEATIRETTKTSLENHGYKILTACDGIEALLLYTQYKNEISVVLMDIEIPFVDGLNTIRILQKINSQVTIIASSGLEFNQQLLEAVGTRVKAFLSKPYTIKDLLDSIHEVLSAS